MSPKKGLLIGFLFAFLVMGIVAMQRAMPDAKEDRIYEAVKVYSPYKLEKRIGGLTIINTQTGIKEKPSAAEVLHRLDELEKEWGKTHLKVSNNELIILGDNDQGIIKIFIENQKERDFLKSFYGI